MLQHYPDEDIGEVAVLAGVDPGDARRVAANLA
jgi:hypothetical protein